MLKKYLCLLLNSGITDYQNLMSEIAHSIKRHSRFYSSDEFLTFVDEEPDYVESKRVVFVYIAGLIELLCEDKELTPPSWISKDPYFLDKPYSNIHGFVEQVPQYLANRTRECFSKRNYFTNEDGR